MSAGNVEERNIIIIASYDAPARAYIEAVLPDVLDATVEPGRVFDRTIGLDDVAYGYRSMADRASLKVPIAP